MVACLVRQAADLLGPSALGLGEPGGPDRLKDRLATLLAKNRPEGERIVVVLDALDEAAEPVDLAEAGLGRGVFVLVTCRAENEEEPPILHPWRDRATRECTLVLDCALRRLDETEALRANDRETSES
jgi:hypothetical protein